jgi:hypothetical protein
MRRHLARAVARAFSTYLLSFVSNQFTGSFLQLVTTKVVFACEKHNQKLAAVKTVLIRLRRRVKYWGDIGF